MMMVMVRRWQAWIIPFMSRSKRSLPWVAHSRVDIPAATCSSTATGTALQTTSALISVEDCLAMYQQQHDNSTSTSKTNIRFVDASWYHKGERSGRAEFETGPRLPGAVYFDLDDICDLTHTVPRMLPPPDVLATALREGLGIMARPSDQLRDADTTQIIIVYGKAGARFTPRVWFTLDTLWASEVTKNSTSGSPLVRLLQGTLEDWMSLGGPVETHAVTTWRLADRLSGPLSFPLSATTSSRVLTLDKMKDIVLGKMNNTGVNTSQRTLIVDARGSSFAKKGHIPGSIHIPYTSLLEPNNTCCFKPHEVLQQIFEASGILPCDPTTRIVCTCNSGVSACSLYLALRECGVADEYLTMYDGSWLEWERYRELPKVMPAPTL